MKESKFNNLGNIAKHIKESGLPCKEEMELQLDQKRENEISQDIQLKIIKYKFLFNKWKQGLASDEEISKMADLSEELEKMKSML